MLRQMTGFNSSLFFTWIVSHGIYGPYSLSISVDGHKWYSLPSYCEYVGLHISLPLNTYPVIGLLNHGIDLFLMSFFWGTSILFPVTTVVLFITTVHLQGLIFFTSLRALAILCLLVTPVLTGVACCPTVVLYFSGNYPLCALVSLYVKWIYGEWYHCLLLWMLKCVDKQESA